MASIIIPGTAGVGDVLAGKVFSAGTNYQATGTMVDRGTVSTDITTKAQQVTIAAGKHSGSGIVKISATEQAKIIAGNIRSGVTILGQTGNSNVVDTSSGDATAAQILATKKAWVDGTEITGSMPNRTDGTHVATTAISGTTTPKRLYFQAPQGYYDGAYSVYGDDANFAAGNIKSGVSIFGLAGSLEPAPNITAGTFIIGTDRTTEINYGLSTLVKLAEIKVSISGVMRVSFEMCTQASGCTVYGRLYKNDIAIGIQRSATSVLPNYTTFSEDITINKDDYIQVYGYSDRVSYGSILLRNLKIGVSSLCTPTNG